MVFILKTKYALRIICDQDVGSSSLFTSTSKISGFKKTEIRYFYAWIQKMYQMCTD